MSNENVNVKTDPSFLCTLIFCFRVRQHCLSGEKQKNTAAEDRNDGKTEGKENKTTPRISSTLSSSTLGILFHPTSRSSLETVHRTRDPARREDN